MINKRTMIIAAAIAIPVLALGTMAKFHANPPGQNRPNNQAVSRGSDQGKRMSQKQKISPVAMRTRIQDRLDRIEKMTPDQWADFKKTHPGAAPTQAEAIANNKARVADLDQKIEANKAANWATQQIQAPAAKPAGGHLPTIDAKSAVAPDSAAATSAPAPAAATSATAAAKPAEKPAEKAASESEPDDQ